ncbi:MAG TPA: hypothetical protein VGM91_06095 [Conexibacter sp.]
MSIGTALSQLKRRRAVVALVALGLSYALVMQNLGWAQTSFFAQIKSFGDGKAQIDRYHWESQDVSWHDGHFYSVKAPGMAMLLTAPYLAFDALGGRALAADVARTAREHGPSRWHYKALPIHNYGYSVARRNATQSLLERQSPMVWALGLLGSVLPAILLLWMVKRVGDRLMPGGGLAAATMLGAGTLVLPFASELFSHVLAATIAFAAFALLLKERSGPARLALLVAAGALAGFAVVTEYPLAIAGGLIGLYAVTRGGALASWTQRLRRAAAYAGGVLIGVVPLAVYNAWAFGTIDHNGYTGAVKTAGRSGHAVLGLNDAHFFGISFPNPGTALELLFSARGLLTIGPVIGVGVYGLVLLYRSGRRAEALLAGGIVLAYLAYDSGYWTPFGGGTPGPRFLIPLLPFAAIGLAAAWRSRPALCAALLGPSVVMLLAATLTRPLIGDAESAGVWATLLGQNLFSNTVLSAVGLGNGWAESVPVIACVAIALWAGLGTRLATAGVAAAGNDVWVALAALVAWFGIAISAPALWNVPAVVTGDSGALALFSTGAGTGLVFLGIVARRTRNTGGADGTVPSTFNRRDAVEDDVASQLA